MFYRIINVNELVIAEVEDFEEAMRIANEYRLQHHTEVTVLENGWLAVG